MRLKRFENTQLYYVDEAIVIGSAEGDYVPLAEYQELQQTNSTMTESLKHFESENHELRRLLERVDAMGEYLHDAILNTHFMEFPLELDLLSELLSDIKEALK